jgi:hypothetical protein
MELRRLAGFVTSKRGSAVKLAIVKKKVGLWVGFWG